MPPQLSTTKIINNFDPNILQIILDWMILQYCSSDAPLQSFSLFVCTFPSHFSFPLLLVYSFICFPCPPVVICSIFIFIHELGLVVWKMVQGSSEHMAFHQRNTVKFRKLNKCLKYVQLFVSFVRFRSSQAFRETIFLLYKACPIKNVHLRLTEP